jgi:hypothetical protein
MECWTRKDDSTGWRQSADVLQGLAGLDENGLSSILLVSDRPKRELDALRAAIGLARKMAGGSVRVIVASPYPSANWMASLTECGTDQIWLVGRLNGSSEARLAQPQVLDVSMNACPALHVHAEQSAHSVCARHHDRMVLGRHHLIRRCLGHYRECPHWRGA